MHLSGLPEEIAAAALAEQPEAAGTLERARALVPACKREVLYHEAAVLYRLARAQGRPGARYLEIGTALGYSAAVIALAAPMAGLVTLNPKPGEYERARQNLAPLLNVEVLQRCSWDYLADYRGPALDFAFVDGCHEEVRRDLPWFAWLKAGGLLLLHDYSPAESRRPCVPVYEAAREFAAGLGREPDVLVVDSRLRGMAGWYRREAETWPRG